MAQKLKEERLYETFLKYLLDSPNFKIVIKFIMMILSAFIGLFLLNLTSHTGLNLILITLLVVLYVNLKSRITDFITEYTENFRSKIVKGMNTKIIKEDEDIYFKIVLYNNIIGKKHLRKIHISHVEEINRTRLGLEIIIKNQHMIITGIEKDKIVKEFVRYEI